MRPGANGEIIFESTLEARVASQLLMDNGQVLLANLIVPPLENPTIGRLEFLGIIADRRNTFEDGVEYSFVHPLFALGALKPLIEAARPCPDGRRPMTRKQFLGQKVFEYATKFQAMPKPETVEVGGMIISGLDAEQASILRAREKVVRDYCGEKGWDISDPSSLSVEQIMEIRSLPAWKNPLGE